jgi:hypothetical protein
VSLRAKVRILFTALLMLGGSFLVAPPAAEAGPPAGTCGASQGCGCGGVYVLKYKYILVYC